MAHDKEGMSGGMLFGFIAGSLVGAVTALLLAPKSGKELRKDIKERSDLLKQNAQAGLQRAQAKAENLVKEGKRRSDEALGQAKQKAAALLSDAEKTLSQAKNEGGKLKSAIKAGADAFKEERSRNS